MALDPAAPGAKDIRAVTRDVAEADNGQVIRIVAAVDALASRGSADQLIAPLRARLAALRPPRPLRFARLMFYPLDPLIVPAARWRPEHRTIPRTAVTAMVECVRLAMGDGALAIEAAISGRTTSDADLIATQGRLLWPVCGEVLASAKTAPGWDETGLGAAAFVKLARRVAALLAQMAALDRLCAETAHGLVAPRNEALHAILRGVSAADESALPMVVTLLLTRLPEAATLLLGSQAASAGGAVKASAELAIDSLLEQLAGHDGAGGRVTLTSLAEAGGVVRRISTLLRRLEDGPMGPARRTHLNEVRQNLDAGCRARFASGLQDQVLAPLGAVSGEDVSAIEAAARDLRMLETEARALGGASAYDTMLENAAEAVKAASGGLERMDQIRLVEILAGADAALAMLAEPAAGR
jgi:hypothetical protein